MKAAAIIAEYNPLHEGHIYHMAQTRKLLKCDYIVVILSGNFLQRGAPAIEDKYIRAHKALKSMADLVIELPGIYATASAPYFAAGAVTLADSLGVIDTLSFGSESGDNALIHETALLCESLDHDPQLLNALQSGLSYGAAWRNLIASHNPQAATVLDSPNNILGVQYCMAIRKYHSSIKPFSIARQGAGYHDLTLSDDYVSASGVRNALKQGEPLPSLPFPLASHLLLEEDLFPILKYKLIMEKERGFTDYFDISSDFSNRIIKYMDEFNSYEGAIRLLQSRNFTYSYCSRALLHIVLDITKSLVEERISSHKLHDSIHVLGFKESARPLLREIKENTSLPLIMGSPEAKTCPLVLKDHILDSLYQSILAVKYPDYTAINEYQRRMLVV